MKKTFEIWEDEKSTRLVEFDIEGRVLDIKEQDKPNRWLLTVIIEYFMGSSFSIRKVR